MKTRLIYFAIVSLILISLRSYAGIPVSGVVSGTWAQGDTMDVVGDLYLLTDSTLIIEPDVVVNFLDYYRFYVYGLILANGTENDSIYFTCELAQNPNRWGGIRFSNANSLCSMSYCVIEKGLAQGSEPSGGGVYCSNSSPSFSYCTFTDNSASEDYGGGIAIYNNSSPDISDCIFSNNTASLGGGGIRIYESSPAFTNCIINGNSANYGGGLSCSENCYLNFIECNFTENYSIHSLYDAQGGAIHCINNCSLNLNSCVVSNNHVSEEYDYDMGGGIYADNCNIILDSCNITGNYYAHEGGGLYYVNSTINLSNCMISNNSSTYGGGGIFFSASTNTIISCEFSNNTSIYVGGGIYFSDSFSSLISCEFNNNTSYHGGGFCCEGNILISLSNCIFEMNNAIGNEWVIGKGGGIYAWCYNISLGNCLFENNTANIGGGVYGFSGNSSSTIQNCTFISNTTDPYDGGAIYNSEADLSISECVFENNECTENGGGINNYNASPTISKCIFDGNIASQGGGIFNEEGGSPIIERCTFFNNSANSGGGIACVNSSPTINSSIFDSSSGFGIYFGSNSSDAIVEYCDFNNNIPINFGGSDIPSGLGIIVTTNYNGDDCDEFFNILLDPLLNIDFTLQDGSPCIDAGDPAFGYDPDSTYVEIGRYCYSQVSVDPIHNSRPQSFYLYQNYPNPFNPVTTISYHLPRASNVLLRIYNVRGQLIETLVNEQKNVGSHTIVWNADGLSSGIYFYKITAREYSTVKKCLIIK